MKLTQLEYFCVAARYHNITKAAKELFVTQPSISNAIKALEEEFGVNLFFRNNNKLTLTPEGEIFYKSAEELLAHADSVESEFHELRKKVTPIRIGIPPMFWKRNWISRSSMQNSLPLINAIHALSIRKTCFSVSRQIILWQVRKLFFSPCLQMSR